MRVKNLITILIILLVSSTVTAAFFTTAKGEQTSLFVEPESIVDPSIPVDATFKINVTIQDVVDLYSWQVRLDFNSSTLECLDAWIPDNHIFAGLPILPVTPVIDNDEGYLMIGLSLMGVQSVSGSGILFCAEFKVRQVGESYLNFSMLGIDTFLLDINLEDISFEVHNGYFSNLPPVRPPTTMYVEPKELIDPTLLPPSTFSINVTLDKVENLKVCQFNLSYNTEILSWVAVEVQEIQGIIPQVDADLNDNAGYIWFNLTYPEPVTSEVSISLVKIKFRIETFGCSVLDLHDTILTDSYGFAIDHDAIDGLVCTLIRDVAITSVITSRTWAYQGWPINVTVTAKNLGNISETFDIEVYYDNTLINTVTVTDLPPQSEANITITWDTSTVPEGNYTIHAKATEVPYEYDTSNNILYGETVWIMEKIHDVCLIDLVLPEWAYQGWNVTITAIVKNLGNYTETFELTISCNDTVLSNYSLTLEPLEETTVEYLLNTLDLAPCMNYTITASILPIPYEFTTENNVLSQVLTIRIMGDINYDGKVNTRDLAPAAQAFGSYPGHPRWLPEADLNLNNKIDMRDIAIIAKNFGKTCS